MKDQKHFLTYLSIFILWIFTISAISGVYVGEKEWFMTKTPLNLLLILGLLILVFPIRTLRKASLFVFIAIVGIFAEWLGVNYGLIFGNYEYGPNFGPRIGGVPYLIGVNWAFLSFATGSIAGKWFNNFLVESHSRSYANASPGYFYGTQCPPFLISGIGIQGNPH